MKTENWRAELYEQIYGIKQDIDSHHDLLL